MRFYILGILLLSFASGCAHIDKKDLLGTWKADLVLEESDTVPADLSKVSLVLNEDDSFLYQMTTQESWSGSYELTGDLLAMHIAHPKQDSITIQVLELAESHLRLRMNHEGKERQLLMSR